MTNLDNHENTNHIVNRGTNLMQTVFYGVWSLLGIVLLVLISVGVFGQNSWAENLNLTVAPEAQQAEQAPQQATPPPVEPTQEQLACVADELGEERLVELEQGQQATEEEAVVIQACLQQ